MRTRLLRGWGLPGHRHPGTGLRGAPEISSTRARPEALRRGLQETRRVRGREGILRALGVFYSAIL